MIVLGSASVSIAGSTVTIDSPGGFGAFRAVRLTNYTANVLVLTNISGSTQGQSQEFLLPLQQMVYQSANVQTIPTVTVFGVEGTFSVAPSVLVEWSTDPLDDFNGTYPVTIGTPSAVPYACINLYNILPGDITSVLAANPFRRSVTLVNQTDDPNPVASGILYASTNNGMNWVGPPYAVPTIAAGAGRTLETTSALYFRTTGGAANGTYLEVLEESWGACSTFFTIGNA